MAKKRVYVSSTFVDLEEHRKAVEAALERAQFDVECMEKYPAFDERPVDKCLADVAQCDCYVLILALRYGFQPPADNPKKRSITQMEYEEAVRLKKPCLVFLLDERDRWPPIYIDTNALKPRSKIGAFRRKVGLATASGFSLPLTASPARSRRGCVRWSCAAPRLPVTTGQRFARPTSPGCAAPAKAWNCWGWT